MKTPLTLLIASLSAGLLMPAANAAVSVSNLYGDHMVIQRDLPVDIRGRADPGEAVTVTLAGNSTAVVAGTDRAWSVQLPALPAGGPHTLRIEGTNIIEFNDVLVGEVWIASGQSNMEWKLRNSVKNADLAAVRAARLPQIRVLQVKNPGSQQPQTDFPGKWTIASADTVGDFTAVGFHFAEALVAALDVAVGIIDNSWGGSAAEAWTPRPAIAAHPVLQKVHQKWLADEAVYDHATELAAYEKANAEWEAASTAAKAAGQPEPPNKPRKPQNKITGNQRPGNLWNARVLPVVPYPARGVIWYQGESNAGRAHQYHDLFSLMIGEWRKAWGRDLPFYWVQLADYRDEAEFAAGDDWPKLREAQTDTLHSVPNTGQAVIIDIGEGKDIHPLQKEEVGRRLARWALNRDYGFSGLACRSPELASWEQQGAKVVLKFNYTGGGLRAFDTQTVRGFAAQQDGQWTVVPGTVAAPDTVELALPSDAQVSGLRYAWANNPVVNLFTNEGLPATPFRTDK